MPIECVAVLISLVAAMATMVQPGPRSSHAMPPLLADQTAYLALIKIWSRLNTTLSAAAALGAGFRSTSPRT